MADPAIAAVALAEPSRTGTRRPGTPKPKPKGPPMKAPPAVAKYRLPTPAVAPSEEVIEVPPAAQVVPAVESVHEHASDDRQDAPVVNSLDDAGNDVSQAAETSFVTALDAQPDAEAPIEAPVAPAARGIDGYTACFSGAVTCRIPEFSPWLYDVSMFLSGW